MLKCKNCGYPYTENQNFCDQCGNPLPPTDKMEEGEPKRWIHCPTCKRKIIETTSICPFCGENINLDQMIEDALIKNKNKSYAVLGLILGMLSVFLLIFFPLAAIPLAILGLALSIIGSKANKKVGITGMIASSLGLLITIILLVLVLGFDYTNEFLSWSIPNQNDLIDGLSGNTKYKSAVYTSWEQLESESLLVLKSEGTYEWYENKKDLDGNYQKGIFILENGVSIKNDMLYEDDHYYYYQLTLIRLNSSLENSKEEIEESTYTLGINKKARNDMCMEKVDNGNKICFKKSPGEVLS